MPPILFYTQKPGSVSELSGKIIPVSLSEQPYEMILEIDGYSYHMIFGRQTNGWFICVPNWDIGTELSYPTDTFWNYERMCRAGIKKKDAYFLSTALYEVSEYL